MSIRRAVAAALVALLAATAVGCSGDDDRADPGPLRVGLVLSMSGAGAAIGSSQHEAIAFALGPKLQATLADDGSIASHGIEAVDRLVDDGVDVIIGPTLSNVTRVAYTGADIGEVPMIGISQTVPGLTAFRPYLWRVSMPADRVIPPAVAAAARATSARSAVVLSSRDDLFSRAEAEVFTSSFEDLGVRVIGSETFVTGQLDLRDVITAVRAAHPDLLAVAALPTDAVHVLTELRTAGLSMPVIGGNGYNSNSVVVGAGAAAENLYVGSAWSVDSPDPENQRFLERWRARFADDPDQFAAQAYAGVQVLREAIRLGGRSRVGIQEGLRRVHDLRTVLGPFSFDTNRDADYPPWVRVVRDGHFVSSRPD